MTSPYLNRRSRSRIEVAYDLAPELREAVEALESLSEAIGRTTPRREAKGWGVVLTELFYTRTVLTKIEQASK